MKNIKLFFSRIFKRTNSQNYLENSTDHADIKKRMEDVMKKMNYYC